MGSFEGNGGYDPPHTGPIKYVRSVWAVSDEAAQQHAKVRHLASTPLTSKPALKRASKRGVFISYRRSDDPSFAGRLYDRLTGKYGPERIFMDVDSIGLGTDFVDAIKSHLQSCKVVIAVIGKGWLDASSDDGQRRLDSPNDYVRLELEIALKRKARVIPVLIEGAQIPHAEELPPSMESLSRRNSIEMSHANFGSDAAKLISTLDRIVKAG